MAQRNLLKAAGDQRVKETVTAGVTWNEIYGIHTARFGILELVVDYDPLLGGYKVRLVGRNTLTAKARPQTIEDAKALAVAFAKSELRKISELLG